MSKIGFFTLLLCSVATALPALDPTKPIDQYLIRSWATAEGLPQNTVSAIAQTADGYLWFATQDGLARFNGAAFKTFDRFNTTAFTNNQVNVLLNARDGALWIGCEGGGLVCLKEGQFTHLDMADLFPGNQSITALAEDRTGEVWIATDNGRLYIKKGAAITLFQWPGTLAKVEIRHLYFDRAGDLWIATRTGLIQYSRGMLKQLSRPHGPLPMNVTCTLQDSHDDLWIGSEGAGLWHGHNGSFSALTVESGLLNNDILSLCEDRQHNLWVGSRGGIHRIHHGVISHLNTANGLTNNGASSIYEDTEGSIWLGTSLGINRLHDGKVFMLGLQSGLPTEFVWSVMEDRLHTLWIGTHGSGLARLSSGQITTLTTRNGLPSDVVRCTVEDRRGRIWIGTFNGLCRLEQNKLTVFNTNNGLSSNLIRSFLEDSKGTYWIGTANGLNVMSGDVIKTYSLSGVPQPVVIFSLFEDQTGCIWLATRHGAIRITSNGYQVLNASTGFTDGSVYSIMQDSAGRIWMGTTDGLCLATGNSYKFFGKKDGLPDNVIYKILQYADDRLIMSSNRGIISLSINELLKYAAGKISPLWPEIIGLEDGMKSSECNGGSQTPGCIGHDGKIYFPTLKGLAVIEPVKKKQQTIIAPVYIEEIGADGKTIPPLQATVLPAATSRLEFHFAALSFLTPEKSRFKYKLDGFDNNWIDCQNRREAFYTNLPPGKFTFRVIACTNDGAWNMTGASFSFSKKPFFYQTMLFYIFAAITVLLTSAGVHFLRVRALKQREKNLALQVIERTSELARANLELERLANTDGLTDLCNRRHFMHIYELEWRRATRNQLPLSLIMIDVDHFKLYNDHYGHQAGDDCLRQIAAVLKQNAERAGDLAARYGGEEFVIMLTATAHDGAVAVAKKLCLKVEGLKIAHESSSVGKYVTISLGIATAVPQAHDKSAGLIDTADQALYQAKADGRNCMRTATAAADKK